MNTFLSRAAQVHLMLLMLLFTVSFSPTPVQAADVQLTDSITWSGDAGAHYDVRVRNEGNGVQVKLTDVGAATSINVGTLLSGLDFNVENQFRVDVRSKLPGGGLESAYSSHLLITVVGFGIPGTPTVAFLHYEQYFTYDATRAHDRATPADRRNWPMLRNARSELLKNSTGDHQHYV